jgi:cyclophilin family peptidyl-prolyl cis-trans isomerase
MAVSRRGGAEGRRRNGAVRPGLESLEDRQLLTVSIDPISPVNVPATKTLFVPVHGTDSSGNPITYKVTSSNPQVPATVRSGHSFLKVSVAGFGDMVFQLFDDLAPGTVSQITKLVNQGFYNGLTFHRVVPNFVIQGGDPKGDGTGGPGFTFPDEFNARAIFDGSGQLAMANSGPNTYGSQFFVTVGPQRFLDFNYNLFGQIVSGQSVLQAIDVVPTDASSKPLTPVKITSASIVSDTNDTVLMIQAPAGTGSSTITGTGTDAVDHSVNTQMFQASFAPDTTNDPPFLNPVANQTTTVGVPVSFPLTSTDLENDPVVYSASEIDTTPHATVHVSGNMVTVTPTPASPGR